MLLDTQFEKDFQIVRNNYYYVEGLLYRGKPCVPVAYVYVEAFEFEGKVIVVAKDPNWDYEIFTFKVDGDHIETERILKIKAEKIQGPDKGVFLAIADQRGSVKITKGQNADASIKDYEFEGATMFYSTGYRLI